MVVAALTVAVAATLLIGSLLFGIEPRKNVESPSAAPYVQIDDAQERP